TAWEFDRRIKSDPHGEGLVLKWMRPVLGLLVLAILATLTRNQGQIYRNPGTLWQDTLNKNPNSWLAHNNLGSVYVRKGNLEEAIQEYLTVLRLQPNHATAYYNLGNAYKLKGLNNEARKQFDIALKLNPNFSPAQEVLESLGAQPESPTLK